MIYDLAIVGAGACGLFAAVNSKPLKIIIFDKKSGAKKLAITGNDRSNISNCLKKEEFLYHYGKTGNFLRDAFKLFFKDELVDYLRSVGFETTCSNGRVVLKNRNSQELSKALLGMSKNRAHMFKGYEPVVNLKKNGDYFNVITAKGIYVSKTVLMSCGGKSYPSTGSEGSCYAIVKKFSHTIVKPQAYEVPFCCGKTEHLKGLSFKDVGLTLKVGKKRFYETGDIIFTHFGVSGPAILRLSEKDFKKAKLVIDFIGMEEEKFVSILLKSNKKIRNIIKDFMPERFVKKFIKTDKYPKEASKKEIKNILDLLFRFEVDVEKCSFDRAFVTKGGISTKEIDPKTMQSKLVRGMFFCGEIMDIQGSIGGFNLQAAFSSSFCAINSIKDMLVFDKHSSIKR